MGCDIHIIIERKFTPEGPWIGLVSHYRNRERATDRWYTFFAEVCSVRGASSLGHTAKGVPEDASELAVAEIHEYGSNGHHHSYMSVQEFVDVYVHAYNKAIEVNAWRGEPPFREGDAIYDLLGIEKYDQLSEHRVVFWFDN